MAQIVYSRNAAANIERLFRFLAAKNPDAAQRATRAIRAKIRFLVRHPRLGRIDHEQPDERELLIPFGESGYLARYRLEGSSVVILAIRHAREAGYTREN